MASGKALVEFFVIALALSWQLPGIQAQLSADYYTDSCRDVESVVKQAFTTQMNLIKIITAPAALLRLAFHDCAGSKSCDASIMLNSQGSITDEKDAERNLGISNLDVIDAVKLAVEKACPKTVSCADVIALVGREAVSFAGGPKASVLLGRRDSLTASTAAAQSNLLPPEASVSQVLSAFAEMGLSTEQTVALLGSHTLGVSHCANIESRLYPQPDATLSRNFVRRAQLTAACPQGFRNPNTVVNNDLTNTVFDPQYYADALNSQGLLAIDDALANDPRTEPIMQKFLNGQYFSDVFATAYGKLTQFNVLTGAQGEIRTNCRFVNPPS